MPADQVAELTASMRPADYVDVGWRELAALVPTLARGWCGILRGDKLEAFYRRHLGGLTLAQLRTPAYAPVWNVEHNRLDFVGPRTHPDLPVARAIRVAVSLPLFIQAARLDG
jgi:NTE family protein